MADIRNWDAFRRGRWNWTSDGYESGFPRGCQFTDIDAAVEFDGSRLFIEAKHYDGRGLLPPIASGQLRFLKDATTDGTVVLILWGDAAFNSPWAAKRLARSLPDQFMDWRDFDIEERRKELKYAIDQAMRLA